ncbi:S-adenosyl-l-methionine hydroxide adenosyltransferase family protein [Roseivirga sp. BDSF3-8]|uniref:SAM hydrolase/SAM-dependent halogenase family protein n=1 Tax=Roseivirga sp. BDSF3-8 TaxID=3241598 RepID=UPI003532543B
MALITFMSDFGTTDHYVAAVKARILRVNPSLQIIDISHQIEHCDMAHGSFVLRSVFRDFPEGSVHLVAVNSLGQPGDVYLAMKLEEHYFVGTDNGLLSLVSDRPPQGVVDLSHFNDADGNFPVRDVLAEAAAKLASGTPLDTLGPRKEEIKRFTPRHSRATKKQISGHVVRVNHSGNLITNIAWDDFSILSRNKRYSLHFGRESLNRVRNKANEVEGGECYAVFNSLGLLEIGISKGNAAELLGLHHDSVVKVIFEENPADN